MIRSLSLLLPALLLAIGFSGCSRGGGDRIRVQLDWFPEPQHGGLYQALALGYFEDEGLQVELTPGGPNINVLQTVAVGQAEIGQSSSLQVMQGILAGMPLINVSTQFHRLPSVLLMHEDNPVRDFSDLDGKRIMARPEAPYIPYLKSKYDINFEVLPQTFAWGQFLADPLFIQEGFFIAEPYNLERQGVNVRWLALWDSGYEGLATLFANTEWLERNPDLATAFFRALARGWKSYLDGNPTHAHELMKAESSSLTDGFLDFSRRMILEERLVTGDPEQKDELLLLNLDRLQRQIDQMESVGVFPEGRLNLQDVATNRYIDRE